MKQQTVVLGVCGSIAAYKAVELTSRLVQQGFDVRVVLTAAAARFVAPLSFESIAHHPVLHDLWAEQPDLNISHVRLGELADVLAIVPATADTIARVALGLADDALTATVLASTAPLLIAPAMNVAMWEHPATQANVTTLLARGARFVGPVHGRLAEGISAMGRLAEIDAIVQAISALLKRRQDLTGQSIVVTAGPTREAIDPVRFISNRSSGKMGYALATAARDRGASVILISGPVALPPPYGVRLLSVTSAAQMLDAVQTALTPGCTLIMAAAVADYAPQQMADQKLKRSTEPLTLQLTPTPDILLSLQRPPGMRVVAFAAETQDLLANAAGKLKRKEADMLVANDVSEPGAGFDADTNHVWLLQPNREPREMPLAEKHVIADSILDALFATPPYAGPDSKESTRLDPTTLDHAKVARDRPLKRDGRHHAKLSGCSGPI
jgi:phosphopantothenoylcysteine decarboxylase/phosphopantothenate--cysteine ligase